MSVTPHPHSLLEASRSRIQSYIFQEVNLLIFNLAMGVANLESVQLEEQTKKECFLIAFSSKAEDGSNYGPIPLVDPMDDCRVYKHIEKISFISDTHTQRERERELY